MKRSQLILIGLILLIGLFFRSYQVVERFEFAHDGDLYSWIVKDVVVNHHSRLIGQLTSAPGIFIGSLFYYLLIPFFLLSNMDPIGVTLLGIFVGIFTILSYYFTLSKLFNRSVGIFAAFLQAVLIPTIGFDRWIVPTLPTKLWAIWYLYSLIMISRGNFSALPILGILIGLIWQIHLALFPALLALPVALFLSHKRLKLKQMLFFLATFFITSTPLILFEMRHNFMQSLSLTANLTQGGVGENGFPKLIQVLNMVAKNTSSLLQPYSLPENMRLPFLFLIVALTFILIKNKLLKKGEVIILLAWFLGVVSFFSFSHTPISEYYFSNLEIIFITIISLLLTLLVKSSKKGLMLIVTLLFIVFIKNFFFFISLNTYNVGYVDRKATVDFIAQDANSRAFPCFGITYITRVGDNVGFRYFLYLKNQHLVHPSLNVPVYNIVIPSELSSEVKQKFGHIGLIPPEKVPPKEVIEKSCQTPNTNLTDSLFGYVE